MRGRKEGRNKKGRQKERKERKKERNEEIYGIQITLSNEMKETMKERGTE